MSFTSKKTYGHDLGLSVVFRQHRAKSHCSKLHGYAIAVEIVFGSATLDDNGWIMDFGGLKDVKKFLVDTFDHKLLVAQDDPQLDELTMLGAIDVADVLVVERTGCEAFAQLIYDNVMRIVGEQTNYRVWVESVEVKEHSGNSATYLGL
jgi:6-pyruvoyltetrahydropterin/6-carboxytetrahydropterin synthase